MSFSWSALRVVVAWMSSSNLSSATALASVSRSSGSAPRRGPSRRRGASDRSGANAIAEAARGDLELARPGALVGELREAEYGAGPRRLLPLREMCLRPEVGGELSTRCHPHCAGAPSTACRRMKAHRRDRHRVSPGCGDPHSARAENATTGQHLPHRCGGFLKLCIFMPRNALFSIWYLMTSGPKHSPAALECNICTAKVVVFLKLCTFTP